MLDDLRQRLDVPTQSCVLTHVTTAIDLMAAGTPVDLVFQSIGGTEATNTSFGFGLATLREAHEAALSLKRGTVGDNVMYFETGQGSALSADAHHGCDQQTIEARAYAVARAFSPLLVNTVVGFIGPEYLYDGKQIIRAGLEDHFCAKLLGVPMGCDVCYTNHAEADQDDMDVLMTSLAAAGLTFIMGVPGADDVMLGYQSTSFHDVLALRQMLGLEARAGVRGLARSCRADRPSGPHPSARHAGAFPAPAGGGLNGNAPDRFAGLRAYTCRPHRARPQRARHRDRRPSRLSRRPCSGAGCGERGARFSRHGGGAGAARAPVLRVESRARTRRRISRGPISAAA